MKKLHPLSQSAGAGLQKQGRGERGGEMFRHAPK
jgi:hypothetical protein